MRSEGAENGRGRVQRKSTPVWRLAVNVSLLGATIRKHFRNYSKIYTLLTIRPTIIVIVMKHTRDIFLCLWLWNIVYWAFCVGLPRGTVLYYAVTIMFCSFRTNVMTCVCFENQTTANDNFFSNQRKVKIEFYRFGLIMCSASFATCWYTWTRHFNCRIHEMTDAEGT